MGKMALVLGLLVSGCATLNIETTPSAPAKQVEVLGRTWTVTPAADTPNAFLASRDNNNLNPFGRPAARRTPQAIRAIELATACRVNRTTLWQDPSATFYADVTCN